jgi:hypothetical protein
MCEHLGKDKKHKKKVDKIKLLPDSYRDEFLRAYYLRAKLKFKLKIYRDMATQTYMGNIEKAPITVDLKN